MANDVFANGMEIACKSGDGKVIAALPDICLSPPSPPAGPIPIPYPDTSFASDTADGSKTVKISGKEVMLKNKSYYKKCTGDEPATKSLGMGVITHCIQGKTHFAMWSSDIKFEGENVDRHLDVTNSNGQSPGNEAAPWPNMDNMTYKGESCAKILQKVGITVHKYKDASKNCKKSQQSDHIIQNACFENSRGKGGISTAPEYDMNNAPCICLNDATNPRTEHGRKTKDQNGTTKKWKDKDLKTVTYKEARDKNLESMKKAKPELKDNEAAMACIKKVLKDYYEDQCGLTESTPVRVPRTGKFPARAPRQSRPRRG